MGYCGVLKGTASVARGAAGAVGRRLARGEPCRRNARRRTAAAGPTTCMREVVGQGRAVMGTDRMLKCVTMCTYDSRVHVRTYLVMSVCLPVCLYVLHVCMYVCAYLRMCISTYARMCACVFMHVCMDAWMHVCMDAWMHVCMDAWMHVCMDAWMHILYESRRLCLHIDVHGQRTAHERACADDRIDLRIDRQGAAACASAGGVAGSFADGACLGATLSVGSGRLRPVCGRRQRRLSQAAFTVLDASAVGCPGPGYVGTVAATQRYCQPGPGLPGGDPARPIRPASALLQLGSRVQAAGEAGSSCNSEQKEARRRHNCGCRPDPRRKRGINQHVRGLAALAMVPTLTRICHAT